MTEIPRLKHSFVDWVLFIASILWVEFYPVKTLEPNVEQYRITTPIVQTGQSVTYEVDACKFTNTPALVYRQLVSAQDEIISLPSVSSNLPIGCSKEHSSTTPIPMGVTPGVWYLQLTMVYQVYGFRTTSVSVRTEDFTITAPTEQKVCTP